MGGDSSIFGTDGIRGQAGEGALSSLESLRLGAAFTECLGVADPQILVARDSRESGELLAGSVGAGIRAAGGAVVDLGVLPTPALALLLESLEGCAAGVMVTASHNPWQDNGLKFFWGDGSKLSDDAQRRCEQLYLEARDANTVTGAGRPAGALEDRAAWALSTYSASLVAGARTSFEGRKVVVDHASGAAALLLPEVLRSLGAEVVEAAPPPDGRNINRGTGAVHPENAAGQVRQVGAWAGIVVDGDADRIVLIDELGTIHDGDAILGALASALQQEQALRGGAVVGTVTTGAGLQVFLGDLGLKLIRTPVGDRHVAAAMDREGCNLGGESSGHVLTPDLCPSGDGSRVAIEVLGRAIEAGLAPSELLGVVPRFPVAHRKVPAGARPALESLEPLQQILVEAARELSSCGGRHLLRYSGTEPVLRIQVEGERSDLVEAWADRLAQAAEQSIASAAGEVSDVR